MNLTNRKSTLLGLALTLVTMLMIVGCAGTEPIPQPTKDIFSFNTGMSPGDRIEKDQTEADAKAAAEQEASDRKVAAAKAKAMAELEAIAHASSNERAESERLFLQGKSHYESGKYDEAILDFKEALQLSPKYGEAYFYIGKSFEQLVKPKPARVAFDQACVIDYKWCTRSTVLIDPKAIPTITPTPPPTLTPTKIWIPATLTPEQGYCSDSDKTNPHVFFGIAGELASVEAWDESVVLSRTRAGGFKDYQLIVPVCDSSGKSLSGRNIHFKVNGEYAVDSQGIPLTYILSVGGYQKIDLCTFRLSELFGEDC
mgnify:FL=1